MEIGLFQLENLVLTQARYLLLDLRVKETALDPKLQKLFVASERTAPEQVLMRLNTLAKDFPIVLLCEQGERSTRTAQQLEAAGFTNVYVVTRGLAGLLAEL